MKTVVEIKTELEAIFDEGINLELYMGIGSPNNREYLRANFDDGATSAVCNSYVAGIRSFFENDDLETLELSNLDRRDNALLFYDLDEAPEEFTSLVQVADGAYDDEYFSFVDHRLKDISTLAIRISSATDSVVFFKKFYPVSLVKRDQILLVPHGSRFGIVENDILKISAGFEVLLIDGEFYINGYEKFEKAFAFTEIAHRAMQAVTNDILRMNIVNDPKGHLAAFSASKSDILRAAKSPVLRFDNQRVLEFAQAKQIGLRVVDGKFELSSRDSVKKLYKLLNDDYLTSGLTTFECETLAKNKLAGATAA